MTDPNEKDSSKVWVWVPRGNGKEDDCEPCVLDLKGQILCCSWREAQTKPKAVIISVHLDISG